MILVNNQPLDQMAKDDPRRQWFDEETKKIRARKEPIVIKRVSTSYSLNKQGFRKLPPKVGIQSRCLVYNDRGREMWACCETYKQKRDTNEITCSPNYYMLSTEISLNPTTQTELIFYLTCVVNLGRHGFYIENQEAEAAERNQAQIAELDVKYMIYRKLELEDLRYIAKAWGVSGADLLTENRLKDALFRAVKAMEDKKDFTKRGYAEFLLDADNKNEELMESRAVVNLAFEKSVLTYDALSRKVRYMLTKPNPETLFLVPLDHKDRMKDYVSEQLIKGKYKDFYDTLREDMIGSRAKKVYSVADVSMMETREKLEQAADDLEITYAKNIGEEKLRERIIEKLQES